MEQMRSEELFKAVNGYEGVYEIGNSGTVRSLDRIIHKADGTSQPINGKRLSPGVGSHGYLTVSLNHKGNSRTYCVHRLVAELFIPNLLLKKQVNHIDGNKLNNSVKNLEWVTHQENAIHAVDIGLRRCASEHPRFKGTIIGRELTSGKEFRMQGTKEITSKGFTYQLVYDVANGLKRAHKGHVFHWENDAAGLRVKGE